MVTGPCLAGLCNCAWRPALSVSIAITQTSKLVFVQYDICTKRALTYYHISPDTTSCDTNVRGQAPVKDIQYLEVALPAACPGLSAGAPFHFWKEQRVRNTRS